MPYVTRTMTDIAPDTFDPLNPNAQSSWFSYVRTVFSRKYEGTVDPPTKTQFMREWDKYNSNSTYVFGGENLESCKEYLKKYCRFLPFMVSSRNTVEFNFNKIKAVTWMRMIVAFNLYAAFRKKIDLLPYNKIDFIGSAGDNNPNRNSWEPHFHGRCVLFISDEKLWKMIQLTEEDKITEFWKCIFEIYDDLNSNPRFKH